MGYYIESPSGLNQGKAKELINVYNCEQVDRLKAFEIIENKDSNKAVICVVENAFFDAAAYCYDEREFLDFANPLDKRRKTWLLMDKNLAESLSCFKRNK